MRETAGAKFYFFDPGVARAVANRLRAQVHDTDKGALLETWVLHELRAHLQIAQCGGEITWYRTGAGVEVDFLWNGPEHNVGIEVKASPRWRSEAGEPLRELLRQKAIRQAVVVYLGDRPLVDDGVIVVPARQWVERLGEFLR